MSEVVKQGESNTDNSEMFKLLADVSKQNSDTLAQNSETLKLNTESITKLTEGQVTIGKVLGEIKETIKENVHQSDNNNPVEEGLGMEQKPKVESPSDVGDKTTAPNAYAPGEYGSAGRGENPPGKDKGGLKMEAKAEEKPKEEEMTKPQHKPHEEMKEGDKPKEENKAEDKPKEENKEEPKKEEKYKSFNYENNTTIRPSVMTKSYESYPDGYQIIKAALNGWDIPGVDADGAYAETIKRLDNYEFGTFGQVETGGSYQ